MTTAQDIADRYVALWTEPDPARRRAAIEGLWAAGGVHLLHPPEEIREQAAALGFGESALEARGYDALEQRVTRAYREFVAGGEYSFRGVGEAVRLRDAVRLTWEMVAVGSGDVLGGGVDVLVLDDRGRIITDYQFPA
ncbi:hypothetical protein [Kitasatospora sp. NPDC002965]|uniref:hypothetical protein n=1 Tax=Kitasatospora sp. NPDC002965 TaxID=3154775 RepID=UPI0033AAAEEC